MMIDDYYDYTIELCADWIKTYGLKSYPVELIDFIIVKYVDGTIEKFDGELLLRKIIKIKPNVCETDVLQLSGVKSVSTYPKLLKIYDSVCFDWNRIEEHVNDL